MRRPAARAAVLAALCAYAAAYRVLSLAVRSELAVPQLVAARQATPGVVSSGPTTTSTTTTATATIPAATAAAAATTAATTSSASSGCAEWERYRQMWDSNPQCKSPAIDSETDPTRRQNCCNLYIQLNSKVKEVTENGCSVNAGTKDFWARLWGTVCSQSSAAASNAPTPSGSSTDPFGGGTTSGGTPTGGTTAGGASNVPAGSSAAPGDSGFGSNPGSSANPASPTKIVFDDPKCFHGSAVVQLKGGARKFMRDIAVGDVVQVAHGSYSPVFMFTHRDPLYPAVFLNVSTSHGESILVTEAHFLHSSRGLLKAKDLTRDDSLFTSFDEPRAIKSITVTHARGVYNPQTAHGDIVASGLLASTYTSGIAPSLAHPLLAPLRALYSLLGISTDVLDVHTPTTKAIGTALVQLQSDL